MIILSRADGTHIAGAASTPPDHPAGQVLHRHPLHPVAICRVGPPTVAALQTNSDSGSAYLTDTAFSSWSARQQGRDMGGHGLRVEGWEASSTKFVNAALLLGAETIARSGAPTGSINATPDVRSPGMARTYSTSRTNAIMRGSRDTTTEDIASVRVPNHSRASHARFGGDSSCTARLASASATDIQPLPPESGHERLGTISASKLGRLTDVAPVIPLIGAIAGCAHRPNRYRAVPSLP